MKLETRWRVSFFFGWAGGWVGIEQGAVGRKPVSAPPNLQGEKSWERGCYGRGRGTLFVCFLLLLFFFFCVCVKESALPLKIDIFISINTAQSSWTKFLSSNMKLFLERQKKKKCEWIFKVPVKIAKASQDCSPQQNGKHKLERQKNSQWKPACEFERSVSGAYPAS